MPMVALKSTSRCNWIAAIGFCLSPIDTTVCRVPYDRNTFIRVIDLISAADEPEIIWPKTCYIKYVNSTRHYFYAAAKNQ